MGGATERSTGGLPHNPERTDRIVVHLPKALTAAVDAYQRRMLIGTRSEALRQLVQAGLEAKGGLSRSAGVQSDIEDGAPRRARRGRGGRG